MSNSGEKKQGGIGAFDFFCIGFGSIVGVGWAVSVNRWMANCGGPLPASFGYILALIMMVPVALCYCELAPMMPVAGGGMAYAYGAFNDKVAFISGWAAFGAFVTIIPWEAIYVVDILSILFPAVKGPELYQLAGTGIHLGHIVIGTLLTLVLFYINIKGATTSAFLQRILVVILILVGLMAIVAALINFDAANFQPIYERVTNPATGNLVGTHKSFMGGSIAILASAPFFLAGFETIPQAVEDAEGDITSVGKTVVLAVGLACVFYAIMLFAMGSAHPWQEFYVLPTPAASNLMKILFEGGLGLVLYYIILLGAMMGLITTWNGFLMASPRLLMGMARGYMAPHFLAKQNAHGVPVNGLYLCTILSLAGPFLGMGLIDPLTSFSAAGFVLSWALTSFSLVRLRQKEPNRERPYKIPGGIGMGWFAAIVMTIVFILLFVPENPVFMGGTAIKFFIAWMVIGAVVFLGTAGQRNALSPDERRAAIFGK